MAIKKLEDELGPQRKKKLDALAESSNKPGVAGFFETFIRKFRNLAFVLLLSPVVFICCFAIGVSLVPSFYVIKVVNAWSATWVEPLHYLVLGVAAAMAYFIYGVSLIFVVPTINFLLPFRVKAFRGIWFSLQTIPWYVHNALTYLVRYTFLEFVTPTPLNILFYRMMGMKVGKGVVINTTNISDPGMITLEDYVTIGGSAHLMAHYGQKGILIIAPVIIKKGATVGLKSSIMGGVTVGEKALVKPHTVLLPNTHLGNGESA